MRKLIVIISFLASFYVESQQLPQQTQYMFNQYAFNPAYAGVTSHWESVMNSRYQWQGIVDAPRTMTLTAHGPFKNKKMGIGGLIYNDIVGPTRRLGFQTSYSYHIKLTQTIKLSMALSFGFSQWLVDADKITVLDENDPFFSNGLIKAFNPDAKFGLYMYHDKWHFGVAFPQILRNKIKFKEIEFDSESYLENHIYINAGYVFNVNQNIQFEPTALLKLSFPTPPKLDIGIKTTYKEAVWLGIGYRTGDALTTMIGYNHKNNLLIGYAYDFTTSTLKGYTTGTHELFFAIRFGNTIIPEVKLE